MTRARGLLVVSVALVALAPPGRARAETGYDLWLRYAPLPEPARRSYAETVRAVMGGGQTATDGIIAAEVRRGIGGLPGGGVARWGSRRGGGAVVAGRPCA